jgi:hypothetical protein
MIELNEKVIDEARQGEAVQTKQTPAKANGRKVYIESYG